MTNQTRYFVEEIRNLRRQHARLVAAVDDALDNLRPDEPAAKRLQHAKDENAKEAA